MENNFELVYEAPTALVIEVKTEGVICTSPERPRTGGCAGGHFMKGIDYSYYYEQSQ